MDIHVIAVIESVRRPKLNPENFDWGFAGTVITPGNGGQSQVYIPIQK
jgi:hypothetical protein